MSDLFSDTNNSPRSSIYWGSGSESASPRPSSPAVFFNLPDAEPATNPPRPQSPTPSPSRNPNTAVVRQHSSSSQLHSSTQDVNRALENLNRAVQTANEAFQATAPLVDLTYSPPPQYAPRSRRSPRRLSNSSINSAGSLFSSPEPPRLAAMPPLLRSRTSAGTFTQKPRSTADEPAPKRQRISYSRRESRDDGPSQQRQASLHEIEAVDLTEVNDASDIAKALAKQRQDAIQAQTAATQGSDSVGRTAFSSYKCPVCMDTPEDATATICGHLFCHKCIIDTLRWSEEQRQDEFVHAKSKGTCPVCRKPMASKDLAGGGRTLIPLEVKLTTKQKAVDVKGKGVARDENVTFKIESTTKGERESSTEVWNNYTLL